MKKGVRTLVQVGISLLFLYLALRNVHFEDAKNVVYSMDAGILIIGTIMHFSSFFVRAYRWNLLMKPIKDVSYQSSFKILSISYAANNVLPLRAGDVVRSIMIGNKERISKVSSFSTVLLERVADGITLFLFLALGLALASLDYPWVTGLILLSLLIIIGTISVITLLLYFKSKFIAGIKNLIGKKSESLALRIRNIMEQLLLSFSIVQSSSALLKILITSFVVWGLEASIFTAGALAMNIPIATSLLIGMLCVSIVNLGTMIPSSPGYVGTFEFFCIFSLTLFGMSHGMAAGYSILIHILQFVPITIIGCLLWLSVDMKYISLKRDLEVR